MHRRPLNEVRHRVDVGDSLKPRLLVARFSRFRFVGCTPQPSPKGFSHENPLYCWLPSPLFVFRHTSAFRSYRLPSRRDGTGECCITTTNLWAAYGERVDVQNLALLRLGTRCLADPHGHLWRTHCARRTCFGFLLPLLTTYQVNSRCCTNHSESPTEAAQLRS